MAERRRYTKKQKADAVTMATASSMTAVSEATGIPITTIDYWMDQPEFAELRRKTRDEMAEGSMLLARLAQAEIAKKVRAGEVEPRDLAVIYGIAIDKAQLLAGGATERLEHRELDEFSDHETRELVDAARKHLAGNTRAEDQTVVEEATVEGAGT